MVSLDSLCFPGWEAGAHTCTQSIHRKEGHSRCLDHDYGEMSPGSSDAVLFLARALGCRDWASGAGRKEGLFLWPKSQVTNLAKQGSTVVST